jgi:hypothetical protein
MSGREIFAVTEVFSSGRIIFESNSWRKRGDIHDLIDKYLNHAQESAVIMRVTQAEMQVTFETADGPDTVPFRITHPDRCSLKDEPEPFRLVLAWRVDEMRQSLKVRNGSPGSRGLDSLADRLDERAIM